MKKSRTLSSTTLSTLDNRKADGEDVKYLRQPRGPGTSWVFRFPSPACLIGLPNPWDGKVIRKTMGRGLGTRHLPTARKLRDQLLGDVRRMEAALSDDAAYSLATAEEWREAVIAARETAPNRFNVGVELALHEKLERAADRGADEVKLDRFGKLAMGQGFPLHHAHEMYLHARRPDNPHGYDPLSLTTTLNLATAVKHLRAFLDDDGETVCLEDMTLTKAIKFRDEYLPGLKGPRSPNGLAAKTITKNITLLRPIWVWAMETQRIDPKASNPWDFPKGLRRSSSKSASDRDDYTPDETSKLLKATKRGTKKGDVVRLAIVTGCRVSEVALLSTAQVKPDGTGFNVKDAKTKSGNRYVPVVEDARTLLQARLAAHGSSGRLFPEWPIRPATGKPAAVSQWFTHFRRKTLGADTDGRLTMHSARHTWFTVATRAGLQERVAHALGGWKGPARSSDPYDHGLLEEQLEEAQATVWEALRKGGYLEGF